jgi:hypothetical protein
MKLAWKVNFRDRAIILIRQAATNHSIPRSDFSFLGCLDLSLGTIAIMLS